MMQNNIISIQPITTWTNGQTKVLTQIRVDNYWSYDFNVSPGRVSYTMLDDSSMPVLHGDIDLTWDLVNSWGSDDTPIFDHVLQTLGLQRQ